MADGNHLFSGLKVLDLARFIGGPAATTIQSRSVRYLAAYRDGVLLGLLSLRRAEA
jgi:hypothetical protein